MSNKRAYSYVVLRYRHDTFAGEFANVGVLIHVPMSGFLGAKMRHTIGRISKIFPDVNGDEFKRVVKNIERSIARMSRADNGNMFASLKDAAIISRQILPDDDSSFFWSSIGSGISDDPAKTLAKLYSRFVGRYDDTAHKGGRDDAAVWKPVRDLLAESKLANRLQPKTISSSADTVEFEHAWKNGAWHCYQPLSFDLATDESIREKARRWAGTILSLSDSKEKFKPHFLVGEPSRPHLKSAYKAALKILALSPGSPEVIEEAKASSLARKIEDEIRDHDAKARAKTA